MEQGDNEWHHTFVVKNLDLNMFEVEWTDEGGKDASYLAVSYYKVVYDDQIENWKIIEESSESYNNSGLVGTNNVSYLNSPILFLKKKISD